MTTLAKRNSTAFPSIFNEMFNDNFWGWNPEVSKATVPAVNIAESEEEYKLELAVPGLKRDDIKINVEDHRLTISSEKESSNEEKTEEYHKREFNYASFRRSFTLPELEIDEDNIDAKFEDGILTVHLPKREEAKPKPAREIEIM